ncbi:MAG: (2Fe-2S)-binding protein [Steroidobacteraceae bacterium]
MKYSVRVNGAVQAVEADADTPLLWVLRDKLHLKGTKFGCGTGMCGACTVHLNGAATRSCLISIASLGSGVVTTIEGIGKTPVGKKVQQAWLDIDVVQCGYCQAGQIMSATALLTKNIKPSDADIDRAMAGNICRCATYSRIRSAIKLAAGLPMTDSRGADA